MNEMWSISVSSNSETVLNIIVLVLPVLFALFTSASSAQVSLTVPDRVNVTQPFTAKCTVNYGTQTLKDVRTIQLMKDNTALVSNGLISDPRLDSDPCARYHLNYSINENAKTVVITLSATAALLSDSGQYQCVAVVSGDFGPSRTNSTKSRFTVNGRPDFSDASYNSGCLESSTVGPGVMTEDYKESGFGDQANSTRHGENMACMVRLSLFEMFFMCLISILIIH